MPVKARASKRPVLDKSDKSPTATEKRKQDAEQVLANFTSIFLGDACNLRNDTKFDAIRLIKERADKIAEVRTVREIGENQDVFLARFRGWKRTHPAEPVLDAIVEGNHEVFESQLMAWLDSLGELSRKHVRELARIAANYRESYCEVGQEAHWARMKVESLLITDLAQELSPSFFKPNRAQPSTPAINEDLAAVDTWSKWVCEGFPDFDVSESGFAEPWAAPAWYDRWFDTRFWIKHGRPERLTVEQTERVSRSYQGLFAERLQNNLTDAEYRVRVELADLDWESPAMQQTASSATETVAKKLQNPREFPTMTHPEARQALAASERKIARLLDEGKLTRCGRSRHSRLITTESVKSFVVSTPTD